MTNEQVIAQLESLRDDAKYRTKDPDSQLAKDDCYALTVAIQIVIEKSKYQAMVKMNEGE